MAEISRKRNTFHERVATGERLDQCPGVVGASVIDQHDLDVAFLPIRFSSSRNRNCSSEKTSCSLKRGTTIESSGRSDDSPKKSCADDRPVSSEIIEQSRTLIRPAPMDQSLNARLNLRIFVSSHCPVFGSYNGLARPIQRRTARISDRRM